MKAKIELLETAQGKEKLGKENELEQVKIDADNAQKKVDELLKGGDYADDQLRIHIEEMEDAVEVLKTGKQKWKNNYKELKEEFDKIKTEYDDLTYNHDQLNEKCIEMNEQIEKLKNFVKEATEAQSESEEEDNKNKTQTDLKSIKNISLASERKQTKKSESRGVTDNDDMTDEVSGSRMGKKKRKIKMSREMSNLMGELDNKTPKSANKITFARGMQCDDLDPLAYLLERANDMINMNIKYENVKAAMDVLSTLLGYNGIDELILSKSGQTPMYATSDEENHMQEAPVMTKSLDKKPKKQHLNVKQQEEPRQKKPTKPTVQKSKSKPRQVQNAKHEEQSEEDYGTQNRTGYKAPGINKRFGGKS